MADIQFVYFDIRGKGEFIRLLLHAAGQKFDDKMVPLKSWPDGKAESPYGQLPYIIYNGKKYGQSLAIASFFARKLGYNGKTEEDALRVDEVIQLCDDLRPDIRNWVVAKNEDEKAEFERKLKEELAPRYLGFFEALLADNGATGFFVGDSASLADFVIYDVADTFLGINPEALSSFPNLQKLRTNVEAIPALQQYLSRRPKTAF